MPDKIVDSSDNGDLKAVCDYVPLDCGVRPQ
jgi:hypothetical protein